MSDKKRKEREEDKLEENELKRIQIVSKRIEGLNKTPEQVLKFLIYHQYVQVDSLTKENQALKKRIEQLQYIIMSDTKNKHCLCWNIIDEDDDNPLYCCNECGSDLCSSCVISFNGSFYCSPECQDYDQLSKIPCTICKLTNSLVKCSSCNIPCCWECKDHCKEK